jgi:choline dehydrogenase-like flavoprotein
MTVANPDYVIIGTGSAGWVLANRLSEDRKNRVCVIESERSIRDHSHAGQG